MGPLVISGNIDNFILGHLPISGNFSLFVKGHSPDVDAFVSVSDNNPSNSFNLFTHGVPSGQSTIFYTNNSITLFIEDNGENRNINSNWSAFTRVADAIYIPYSGIWQSFVKGGNIANDNVGLYINSHASGDSPHGILITDSLSMFINGQATQDGDEGLLSDGFGLNNTVNLYISGEIAIIPPSAILNLSIFGIIDTTSGSSILFIPSKESFTDNYDLFIFGVQGIESGSVPLYIEVTDIGLFNQEFSLYSHGY
jgi:hypothetical protein